MGLKIDYSENYKLTVFQIKFTKFKIPAILVLADLALSNSILYRFVYLIMTLDDTKIKSIKNYFKTQPVLKAYLFGSYVRGMADKKSDIDILVDLDYSQKTGLKFIQMKLDLEKLLNNQVDLVSTNGLSKYIKPLVDVEKRLIYEK